MKQKTKLKDYKVVKSHYKKKIKIPSDWIFEPLQSKINVLSGFAFNSQNFDKENGIPLIRIRDLANINTQIHYNGDFSKEFLINTGDLLVGMDGEFCSHLWKGGDALLNQRVCKITTASEKILHQRFIYYTIKKELRHYELINVGTTVIHLSKSDIENISILFPTILEQQKIASILSGVDALIESTQNIIEKTERLKKGLMQQLLIKGIKHTKFKKVQWWFNKEIEIPEEWNIKKLWELSEKIKDIVAGPFGSDLTVRDYRNEGVPIIRLQNIGRNKFINKNIKFINNKKAEDLAYHSYIPNDLVLAKLGDPIGKTCKIPENFPEGIVVADVVRIRTSSKKSNQNFLEYVLNSNICEKQHIMETIGTTRPRVNLEQIRNLQFPTPPINEQQKIASILSGVDAYIQKNQQYKERLEKLKKGLMQKLLTGQIRVKV